MENEKNIDRVGTLSPLEELTEWLETHDIDDPDYDQKFAEHKILEEDENGES